MEDQLREYVVTLHNHGDLEGFYEDMETPGGDLYIPDRKVENTCRIPESRNSHYLLSDEEVKVLREDSRVRGIRRVYSSEHYKRSLRAFDTITSSQWSKDYTTVNPGDINWAILRCSEGENRTNWGSDATSVVSGTAKLTGTGRNVDVVIVDTGHANPDSPEFEVNLNGTVKSRYVKYNWFDHTDAVRGTTGNNSTYIYPTDTDGGSSGYGPFNSSTLSSSHGHAYHVTAIAAGNTQGWARNANIYGITNSPVDSIGTVPPHLVFKYILEFHNSKEIDPDTGVKNPTIVNNSWGIYEYFGLYDVTKIHYRGADYTSNITGSTGVGKFGIRRVDDYDAWILVYDTAVESQIEECINAGIIFVGAAGNDYYKLDTDPGENELTSIRDYYNKIYGSTYDYDSNSYIPNQEAYFNRGTVGALANSICVSNVANQTTEERAHRVQIGPRIDVFAPGVAINSCTHTEMYTSQTTISAKGGAVSADPRTGGDYFVKLSLDGEGATSMSSPQVCGMLACILESYPRMNQQDCRDLLIGSATINQIGGATADLAPPSETNPDNVDWTSDESLYGAPNRYLYYKRQRDVEGFVYPRLTAKSRGKETPRGTDGTSTTQYRTGAVFPRPKYI